MYVAYKIQGIKENKNDIYVTNGCVIYGNKSSGYANIPVAFNECRLTAHEQHYINTQHMFIPSVYKWFD